MININTGSNKYTPNPPKKSLWRIHGKSVSSGLENDVSVDSDVTSVKPSLESQKQQLESFKKRIFASFQCLKYNNLIPTVLVQSSNLSGPTATGGALLEEPLWRSPNRGSPSGGACPEEPSQRSSSGGALPGEPYWKGPTGGACRASWSCFQTAACPWSVSRWASSPPSGRRIAAQWQKRRRCGAKAGGAGASQSGWAGWDTDSSHTPLAHTGISPADPPRGPRQTARKHLETEQRGELEDEATFWGSHPVSVLIRVNLQDWRPEFSHCFVINRSDRAQMGRL